MFTDQSPWWESNARPDLRANSLTGPYSIKINLLFSMKKIQTEIFYKKYCYRKKYVIEILLKKIKIKSKIFQ